MNAHNKMWQKQYRNISDVSEQKNLQYLKYSQWGRSWGEGWHQYVHLSMDFKATDVTINRQNLLKVKKHFQIPHSVVTWTGRSNCKACEMEWQTVGQFKGTF